MKKALTLLVILVMAFAMPVSAATLTSGADSDKYSEKVPAMLFRGAGNLLLAPVELIWHTVDESINGEPFVGFFTGLWDGTKNGLDHAGRGVLDVLGALWPGYHGAPPEHTAEILG